MDIKPHRPQPTNLPGRILARDTQPNLHLFAQETPQELWRRLTAGRWMCDFCRDPARCLVRVYLPISFLVQQFPGKMFKEDVLLDPEKCREPYAAFTMHPFCEMHATIGEKQCAHQYPSMAAIVVDRGPKADATLVQVIA
jgi:hypothetical protein